MKKAPNPLGDKIVWVAGHTGLLGSALVRRFEREPVGRLLTPSRSELDLHDGRAVEEWVGQHRPDVIFLVAGRVGGVLANSTWPVEFLQDNLAIVSNVLRAAHRADVGKVLSVASAAMYPVDAAQPIVEEDLLRGPLDPSHASYALAKIAGVALCDAYRKQHGRDYISAAPCNLYGPGGATDPASAHVVNGLICKAHEAKLSGAPEMVVWGSGEAMRELLFVDDCADALRFLMATTAAPPLTNIGSGMEISIADLAATIARVVGFDGDLAFDRTRPEGARRRLLSIDRIRRLGWSPSTSLETGLQATYAHLRRVGAAVGPEDLRP